MWLDGVCLYQIQNIFCVQFPKKELVAIISGKKLNWKGKTHSVSTCQCINHVNTHTLKKSCPVTVTMNMTTVSRMQFEIDMH